jgi:kynurenine 3-monooxygenase
VAKTIVIGAGLVGSVMAMYLSKAGHEVEVYEKNGDPRESQLRSGRSINITLCERGFEALEEVGLDSVVRGYCVPAYGRIVHFADGSTFRQDYGNQDESLYSIARADLSRVLVDFGERTFGVRFHFDQKCVDVDVDGPSATIEHVQSGESSVVRADVIFAADGVNSPVRNCLQRRNLVAFEAQNWDQGYKEINIPSGEQGWLMEREVLHLWPRGGYMFIGFPNLGGDFTGSLHLPFHGGLSFESLNSRADVRRLFECSFPDVLPAAPRLLEDFVANPVNRMTTVRCQPWSVNGKIVLIGDAAHAIYPSYGQGANAGFEDCRLLQAALDESDNWNEAFEKYETQRRPSTHAIADLCIEHFVELRDHVADASFQLRKEVERRVSDLLPDFYKPLYSMISFTLIPYDEALLIEKRQREMIDSLMAMKDLRRKMETGDFAEAVRRLARLYA